MGREIKRVPLNFDFPIDSGTWSGYVMPDKFNEDPCPDCERGYSWQYERLHALWYGYTKFDPKLAGSTPLTIHTPVVRAFAERNVGRAPEFYGTGEQAVDWEAHRLVSMWNQQWNHHLSQGDVDALVADGRLRDFTHTFDSSRPPTERWQPIEPPVHPTATQINEWSIRSMGHDSINAYVVINARCERYGTSTQCATCEGNGSHEAYPGQREEAEKWERTEPPTGEGWQLWQTVSDGPISPVFETPEELARWMSSSAYNWGVSNGTKITYESALAFITGPGWAPSFVGTSANGLETGEQFMSRTEQEKVDLTKEETQ